VLSACFCILDFLLNFLLNLLFAMLINCEFTNAVNDGFSWKNTVSRVENFTVLAGCKISGTGWRITSLRKV
jgi:hypothetical protein